MMRIDPRWLLIGMTAVTVGCDLTLPSEFPLSRYTKKELLNEDSKDPVEIKTDAANKIKDLVKATFGTPDHPDLAGSSTEEFESVHRGSVLYHKHCIHCHGLIGDGKGPTAAFLMPRPRDYRKGVFKWKSTKKPDRPTRDDLLTTIKNGAMGTSMPPFRLMPDESLNDLVNYVIFLAKRGEFERGLMRGVATEDAVPEPGEVLEPINAAWANSKPVETDETLPPAEYGSAEFQASVARGKKHFLGEVYACYKCHGKDGQANPEQMAEAEKKKMFDDWGFTNYPRNLLLGMYRGGRRPIDIFRRVHQGIAGSAMPEQFNNPKRQPGEIWDLVNFVRALPTQPELLAEPKSAKSHASVH